MSLSNQTQTRSHVLLAETRRHSWFGNLLDDSDESDFSRSKHESKNGNLFLAALNLKTERADGEEKSVFKSDRIMGSEALRTNENSSTSSLTSGKDKEGKTNLSCDNKSSTVGLCSEKTSSKNRLKLFDTQRLSDVHCREPLPSRLNRRRATIHYTSTGSPALMDHNRRTAYSSLRPNEIRALELLKDVCRDYIVYKLNQRKLMSKVVIDREKSKESWLFREVVFILRRLETIEKKCFVDIASQTGVKIRSEEILRKTFFQLSNRIITTEIPNNQHDEMIKENLSNQIPSRSYGRLQSVSSQYTEITWGRLCAILSVAAGLAVDCVQHGHSTLVNYLIDYIGEFAREEEVLDWITTNGGWEALKDLNQETKPPPRMETQTTNYNKITNTVLVFVFCSIGAVFAAFTAGN